MWGKEFGHDIIQCWMGGGGVGVELPNAAGKKSN